MEDCCEPKTAEEINLVRKIESGTKHLLNNLNSIENLTNLLNKNLLPSELKAKSETKVEQRSPQGWLECHLADLDTLARRAEQIYAEVIRLTQATKTDKVGQ